MELLTPSKRWPIWVLSAGIPSGLVATSFLYYPLLLKSGVLDPNADSTGIPMFQDLYLAIVATPFVVALTWVSLRKYQGKSRLFGWNGEMPVRSWVTSILVALIIAELLSENIMGLISPTWWCEIVWLPYSALWVVWLLMLRAASLSKR
ncbi:hypothetical protein [Aquisediminimonas profunda]|uniref:hypothetical protein n=1 Tax=Aquisediminimonas profunda TaxID=1550733 RepID=UPI001C6326DD|nr:hypothetical protein [Aquisediminimonas profunda]